MAGRWSRPAGWVERSETHRGISGFAMGFAALNPSYLLLPTVSLPRKGRNARTEDVIHR